MIGLIGLKSNNTEKEGASHNQNAAALLGRVTQCSAFFSTRVQRGEKKAGLNITKLLGAAEN